MNMNWTILHFGKHKGLTLPQLLFKDPDWFFWAYEENVLYLQGFPMDRVYEIYEKATSMRPNKDKVTIYYDSYRKRFLAFDEQATGPSIFRDTAIDLSIPRRNTKCDKQGNRYFLSRVKLHLFGSSDYRMTKRRCEEFFEDDRNFVLDDD